MSQDLSISQDEYDSSRTDDHLKKGDKRREAGIRPQDKLDLQSPATYQSMSNEGLTQGDIVPLARQGTDTETVKNKPTIGGKSNFKGKKFAESTTTHNINGNLSQSNITAYNQNGTIHSDAQLMHARTTKDTGKNRMGSSKVIPFDTTPTMSKQQRRKFGAGTVGNADEIPLDQSVLNSRFLISEYLQKH